MNPQVQPSHDTARWRLSASSSASLDAVLSLAGLALWAGRESVGAGEWSVIRREEMVRISRNSPVLNEMNNPLCDGAMDRCELAGQIPSASWIYACSLVGWTSMLEDKKGGITTVITHKDGGE